MRLYVRNFVKQTLVDRSNTGALHKRTEIHEICFTHATQAAQAGIYVIQEIWDENEFSSCCICDHNIDADDLVTVE